VDRVNTDMIAGHGVGLIEVPVPRLNRNVPIGDVICFEVGYDDLVLDSVLSGAEMLVVQTNNASFGRTAESTQQLALSRLRAIEFGRTTVQISTVGVSAVITPSGHVVQRTGLFTAEELLAQAPLRTSITPAAHLGPWLSWLFCGAAAVFLIAGFAGASRVRREVRVRD
jgi:apolipoprotein N-acyltransferase